MARSLCPLLHRSLYAIALLSLLTTTVFPGLAFALPLVAITRPTQGATVSGIIWVDVAFRADSNRPITRLEVYIDDALAREVDLASPVLEGRQSFNWDFSYAANTMHKIGARAIDSGGNANTASVTVQVQNAAVGGPDRIPPVVRVYYPAQGARLHGDIEIRAEAQDNTGVELVYFYVDGRLHKMIMNAPPYVDLWDTAREADGTHVLEAVAVDAAENEARSAQVTVIVENHNMTAMSSEGAGGAAAPPLPTVANVQPAAVSSPAAAPAVTSPVTVVPDPAVEATKPAPVASAPTPAAPRVAAGPPTLPAQPMPQAPAATSMTVAPSASPAMRTSLPKTAGAAPARPATSARPTLASAAKPGATATVASLPKAVARALPATATKSPSPAGLVAATSRPAPRTGPTTMPRATLPEPVVMAAAKVPTGTRSTVVPAAPPKPVRTVEMTPVTSVTPAAKAPAPPKPAPRVAKAAATPSFGPAVLSRPALTACDSTPVPAARMLARLPEPAKAGAPEGSRLTKPSEVSSAAVPLAVAKVRDIKIVFDGEILTLRTAPETRRGLSLAPLREIFEHTDGVLYWFPVEKTVHAVNKAVDMKLTIGNPQVQVNGEARVLEVAPYIKQGRTMVPLQFIAETLDVRITFDSQTGQILIASNQQ